jgi:chromosomal replication initiation ATPase DnaA
MKVTGRKIEEIKKEKGSVRQVVMDLLYRVGGLMRVEIGEILGMDYSTVSQGRRRLREKIKEDRKLKILMNRIERYLSA